MNWLKKLLPVLVVIILFSSCAIQHIDVQVLYPPVIRLPDHIHRLAVVNGSNIDSALKATDVITGVITGKALSGDKLGSEDCISAFNDRMNTNGTFQCVIPASHSISRGMFTSIPKPLDWKMVRKVCRENGADALVVLEAFNTISDATLNTVKSITDLATIGGTANYPIHYQITYYWRIYDTLSSTVNDEYGDVISDVWYNPAPFQPLPTQAVRNSGNWLGQHYAERFLSLYYWQPREYYKKGNDDFKKAARKATVNDWSGAMQLWTNYTDAPKNKLAGRACYNMAVGCEVLGKIEEAKSWAQKAYADYGLKKAVDYLDVLNYRPVVN